MCPCTGERNAGFTWLILLFWTHLSKETWEAIAVMTDNAAMLQKKDKYKTENGKEEEYNMCQALEELMEDNKNEGRNEGNLEKTKTVVRNMLDRGYEIEDICAIAGCEASFVEEVKRNCSCSDLN